MGIPWIHVLRRLQLTSQATGAILVKENFYTKLGSVLLRSAIRQKYDHRMLSQCCTKRNLTIPTISGNSQSPINIASENAVKDDVLCNDPICFTEDASVFTLQNTGSSLNAEPEQEKEFKISGGPLANPYSLVGFHFHWVKENEYWSEHTVDDKVYSGELHLVHLNKLKYKSVEEALNYQDGLCVLGVFLQSGNTDHKELGMLTQYFKNVQFKCASIKMKEPFHPYSLLPSDRKSYWSYPGSLTTPPYSECVTWVVFKDAIQVSDSQMLEFRSLKPATVEDAREKEKNNMPLPETTTNVRNTFPLGTRIIKSSFAK